MRSHVNNIVCVITAIVLSFAVYAMPVVAAEQEESLLVAVDDTGVEGSLTIQLEDTKNKAPLNGVKFAIVKVADVIDGEFVLHERFLNSEIDLNAIANANALEETASKIADIYEQKSTADNSGRYVITDEKGTAYVDSLDIGVYLIYPLDIADYEQIAPFLISIPTFNSESGHMMYDVLVYPKHTPVRAPGTGIANNAVPYFLMSAACLILAGLILFIFRKMHKEY